MTPTGKLQGGGAGGGGSWFQRHPRRGRVVLYLVLGLIFLAGDFTLSTIRKSVTDVELIEPELPTGHCNKSNYEAWYGMRCWDPFKTRLRFNNLGFRDDEPFAPAALRGKKVIFAVGDSTTAAFEVPIADSYPHVLNEVLGKDYRVFNAGVRAYDTQQVILHYLTKLRALKPYAVIYLIAPNDMPHNVHTDFKNEFVTYFGKGLISEKLDISYCPPQRTAFRTAERRRWQFKTHFNLTSYLCAWVRQRLGKKTDPASDAIFSVYYSPETMQRMEILLRYFDRITAADGVKLYVSYFPHPEAADDSLEHKAYRHIAEFVGRELPRTVFIPVADDIRDQYRRDPRKPAFAFRTNPHANAYGNRELGQATAAFLRQIEK